jgi:hypothetical protein
MIDLKEQSSQSSTTARNHRQETGQESREQQQVMDSTISVQIWKWSAAA